jgi:hypothetical protein
MTLSMFVKGKVDFRCVQIWLWVFLLKEKLTLDVSKYDFEYFYQHVQIWYWVCLSMEKEKLTLDMSKYDFKYVYQQKN